jgi:hypothetical protein
MSTATSPPTWLRKTGEIINRIATNAGVSGALIDSASLTALDTAVPYNINLYLTEQTTVLEIARRLARPCNAQAGVSWLGKLFVTRVVIGTPALTLDAQGRRKPGVTNSSETDVSPPYWRLEMGAQRSWRVHTPDEIASYAQIVPRGAYSASAWYREGNVVTDQGTSWQYINPTPSSGNAPPTLPTASNSYWKALGDPGSSIVVTPSASDFRTTDNAYNPSSQTITFSAALYNLSGTISWTAKNPGGTTVKSGTGTSFSLAQSDMGTNLSLVVTATCGWASSQPVTIGVVDDSTADAGATSGRNRLTNGGAETGTVAPWAEDTSAGSLVGGFSANSSNAHGGGFAFLLAKTATSQSGSVNAPVMKVTPGQVLLFRGWAKGGVAAASGFYAVVNERTTAPSGNFVTFAGSGSARTSVSVLVSNAAVATSYAKYGEVLYTVPAGVFFISLTFVNDTVGPLNLYIDDVEFYELTDAELNADVTSAVTGATDIKIACDYTGAAKSGILTLSTAYKLMRNGVQVTSGITWTYTVLSGSVNGFDNTASAQSISGAGGVNFDVASIGSSTATVRIKAVYGTTTRVLDVTIAKVLDPPPVGTSGGSGNPGTTASTSSISGTSLSTYSGVQAGPITCKAGTAGTVTLTAPLDFYRVVSGSSGADGKWQWRVVGGVFADVTTEIASTINAGKGTDPDGNPYATPGTLNVNMSKTGLTSGTDYEFQLLLRGQSAVVLSYDGTATATGS